MKPEKRNTDTGVQTPQEDFTPSETPAKGKKPVVIYIMILFIAAFLLMALSFLMHQRSNTEVLGELQNSVNAIQTVQDTQEKFIELQEELSKADEYLNQLQEEKEKSAQAILDLQEENYALLALYTLQQEYLSQDYESCRTILQTMEDESLVELLPKEAIGDTTAPNQRYQQLKEAVLNK